MLQKEFEDRIGRKVTTEEYVEGNAVYMMAGELDKDEFCREWLEIGDTISPTKVREELEKKAVWLVGRKEVVKRKAAHEYIFSKEDLEYITNNL